MLASSQSEDTVARATPDGRAGGICGVELGPLTCHEADDVAVVPVREAHELAALFCDRHAGGDRIERSCAQLRDERLPLVPFELAVHAHLRTERANDLDIEAGGLARVVEVVERRIVAHRADAELPVGGERRPGYNREPGEEADREYDRCGSDGHGNASLGENGRPPAGGYVLVYRLHSTADRPGRAGAARLRHWTPIGIR